MFLSLVARVMSFHVKEFLNAESATRKPSTEF